MPLSFSFALGCKRTYLMSGVLSGDKGGGGGIGGVGGEESIY